MRKPHEKVGLFARGTFTGFGPHTLQPESVWPITLVEGSRPAALKLRVRRDCPARPGVYGMLDARGELIYVGKSKCLRARLLSYFRPRSRDPKAGDIVREARAIAWEPALCEFGALVRELELIQRWRPRFNVQGQPHRRRRTFLCLGRRPAPYAFLSARPTGLLLGCYGPIPAGEKASEAARRLNDFFRLRDCPQAQEMVFSDQQELFPLVQPPGCIRYDIGTCLGPCAALCTRSDYETASERLRAFLDGRDIEPLKTLARAMLVASKTLQFERAAALRDQLEPLVWLHRRLAFLRRARALSAVYEVSAFESPTLWYVIQRGFVRAVLPKPEAASPVLADELERLFSDRPTTLAPALKEQVEGLVLVGGWFRKHPAEKLRLQTPAQAIASCRGNNDS